MNLKYFILLFLVLLILILLILINTNFKETFVCLNPTKHSNLVCKNDFTQINNQNYCNDNNNCNGYISYKFEDYLGTNYTGYIKCLDNWSGELFDYNNLKNKISKKYKNLSNLHDFETYKCNNTCPPGKGIKDNSNTCLDCDDDEYNTGDSYECKKISKCPDGYLETKNKKTGIFNCIKNISKCPEGHILNSSETYCIQCDLGEKPNIEGKKCIPCPIGTYGSEKGICTKADKGYYVDLTGQTIQKQCENNTFSNTTGASSCSPFTNCEPGQKIIKNGDKQNDRECQDCEFGYYSSDTNSDKCLVIEPGYKTVKTNSKNTGQIVCGDNTYSTDEISENCTPCDSCPTGKYRSGCSGSSPGTCTDCSDCPKGKYRSDCTGTSPGRCTEYSIKKCVPGKKLVLGDGKDNNSQKCEDCPAGTYNDLHDASTECKTCSSGTYSLGGGNSTSCKICSSCGDNKYKSKDCTTTQNTVCTPCSSCGPNQYKSSDCTNTQNTGCTPYLSSCPYGHELEGGTYTSDKTCKKCPYGYYSGGKKCEQVPGGFKLDYNGAGFSVCELGTYSRPGAESCTPAEKGHYLNYRYQTTAKPCELGTYSNTTGSTSCIQAEPNSYIDEKGQITAKPCHNNTITRGVRGSKSVNACKKVREWKDWIYDIAGSYQWTCPPGVNKISVVAVGGGGGGGNSDHWSGTGGGGGGLIWANDITVQSGKVYTIIVGAGGQGSQNENSNGQDGGDTKFINNGTESLIAHGGKGGKSNSGRGYYWNFIYSGGNGGSKTINISGHTNYGGGNGGKGGANSADWAGGGGGAGGYTGNGGDGNRSWSGRGSTGQGGGGGGGSMYDSYGNAAPGGGVGIYGRGNNGIGGSGRTQYGSNSMEVFRNSSGKSGSGGIEAIITDNGYYEFAIGLGGTSTGGKYGGGGGGYSKSAAGHSNGGNGALRIIYHSEASFPTTKVSKSDFDIRYINNILQ